MQSTEANEVILNKVLSEFEQLTKIPRKSGHEQAISDYLLQYAKSLGLEAIQDEVNNIIIEKPAAAGCANLPMVILQGHMDMVCVAADGKAYDSLKDSIEMCRKGDYLVALGTSLGADDGIGVATILYLLQEDFAHGPLRAIITVDEEDGMNGAKQLDVKYLAGQYLINCDSEDFNMVTVSSAGSINIDFKRVPTWHKPKNKKAYELSVKGFIGGHSGMEINRGYANAIHILALTLDKIQADNAKIEIAAINGGMARNAIAASAQCIMVLDDDMLSQVDAAVADMNAYMAKAYGNIEINAIIEYTAVAMPDAVLAEQDSTSFLHLLCLLQHGVHAMSQSIEGLVETSANLGIAKTTKTELTVKFFPRSAVDVMLEEIKQVNQSLAKLCGFEISFSSQSPGWPANPNSRLAPLAMEIFAVQNKEKMKAESIHAGLECSWFYKKNPALDMISVGPTLTGVHSPDEKLHLATVVPHVKLLKELLTKLK